MVEPQVVDTHVERRRKRRRGIVASLAALSLLTIGAGSLSLAQFTDSTTSTWSFTAGTIDISTSPTVFTSVTNMMPGDNVTQALTVTNGGTGDLRYAMSTVATPLNSGPTPVPLSTNVERVTVSDASAARPAAPFRVKVRSETVASPSSQSPGNVMR